MQYILHPYTLYLAMLPDEESIGFLLSYVLIKKDIK